eukprot:12934806-Alexandrium_andersonii.AAC.1
MNRKAGAQHKGSIGRSTDWHQHQTSPCRVRHRRLRVFLKRGSEGLPREMPQDAGAVITKVSGGFKSV